LIHNQCQSRQLALIPVASLDNLYQWECFKGGFILTFIFNKEKNPSLDRLINIHQLSRCEAICALHFMQTPSIAEIAENTHRSQETVRNHLKRSMQKMNCHFWAYSCSTIKILDSVFLLTPRALAVSVIVKFKGSIQSSLIINPG